MRCRRHRCWSASEVDAHGSSDVVVSGVASDAGAGGAGLGAGSIGIDARGENTVGPLVAAPPPGNVGGVGSGIGIVGTALARGVTSTPVSTRLGSNATSPPDTVAVSER